MQKSLLSLDMRLWYGARSCVAEVTQAKGFHVGLPRKRGTSDARAFNGNGFDTKVPECFCGISRSKARCKLGSGASSGFRPGVESRAFSEFAARARLIACVRSARFCKCTEMCGMCTASSLGSKFLLAMAVGIFGNSGALESMRVVPRQAEVRVGRNNYLSR